MRFFASLPEAAKTGDIAKGVQAMLDLLDPVPADVNVIVDVDGDTWERYGVTTWRFVPRRPNNLSDNESIMDVIEQYGPITWEGKGE